MVFRGGLVGLLPDDHRVERHMEGHPRLLLLYLHFMEKSHRLLILVFCRGVIALFQGKRNGIVLTLIGDFRKGFKLQVQQLDLRGEFFASGFVIARDLQLGFRHCGFALEGGEIFAGFGIKFQFSFP